VESTIAQLVSQFENGTLSRRQLIQALAMIAAGRPVAAAVGGPAMSGRAVPSPAPWQTVWLDHISFQVADYQKSVAFYSGLMGWRVKEDTGTQATLDLNGLGAIIIRTPRRPDSGNAPSPAPAPKPAITGVVDHISWGVQPWDTDAVKAELEKRGLTPRPDMQGDDFKSFHVRDPDGWDLQISNQTKEQHRL
jgi:catechol 2,3-dioxygenase-like lactoylglutathione lyase family enzyme